MAMLSTPSASFPTLPADPVIETSDDVLTFEPVTSTAFLLNTPRLSSAPQLRNPSAEHAGEGEPSNGETEEDELTENDVDLLMGALDDDSDNDEGNDAAENDGDDDDDNKFMPLEEGDGAAIQSRFSFSLPTGDAAFEPIESQEEDGSEDNEEVDNEDDDESNSHANNQDNDGDDEASSEDDHVTEPASAYSEPVRNESRYKRTRPGVSAESGDEARQAKKQQFVDEWSEAQAVSSLISAPFL